MPDPPSAVFRAKSVPGNAAGAPSSVERPGSLWSDLGGPLSDWTREEASWDHPGPPYSWNAGDNRSKPGTTRGGSVMPRAVPRVRVGPRSPRFSSVASCQSMKHMNPLSLGDVSNNYVVVAVLLSSVGGVCRETCSGRSTSCESINPIAES